MINYFVNFKQVNYFNVFVLILEISGKQTTLYSQLAI